jgi:large subunit ribosomal protein LP0
MSEEIKVENPNKVRKNKYIEKLKQCIKDYKSLLLISIDFVGSKQMANLRMSLRGRAVILMGKNTIIRKIFREAAVEKPSLEGILPLIKGNVGFVFCNEDLAGIRKEVIAERMPAAAKTGAVAPIDVVIPAGGTGLDPGQTSFFQALNIGTKITKGSIEILSNVTLCQKGAKVTSSAVALLNKLGIRPFEYGIEVSHVYDNGSLYDAKILDMTEADLLTRFFTGVNHIAAIGLEVGYPTLASIPHSMINGFRKLVAIALETDYMFEEAKIFKEMLDNPDAFKSAAPAAGGGGAAAAAAPEPEPEEEEEEEGFDGGFDLFD